MGSLDLRKSLGKIEDGSLFRTLRNRGVLYHNQTHARIQQTMANHFQSNAGHTRRSACSALHSSTCVLGSLRYHGHKNSQIKALTLEQKNLSQIQVSLAAPFYIYSFKFSSNVIQRLHVVDVIFRQKPRKMWNYTWFNAANASRIKISAAGSPTNASKKTLHGSARRQMRHGLRAGQASLPLLRSGRWARPCWNYLRVATPWPARPLTCRSSSRTHASTFRQTHPDSLPLVVGCGPTATY